MSWYDFNGVLVTDRGTHLELCVTDLEVDMTGAKDQVAAEEKGFL